MKMLCDQHIVSLLCWRWRNADRSRATKLIQKGDVVVVPLHGEISHRRCCVFAAGGKTAESNGASAIIFEMNTYGGRLDSATEIVNAF